MNIFLVCKVFKLFIDSKRILHIAASYKQAVQKCFMLVDEYDIDLSEKI